MQIAGLTKNSTLDFPGCLAAVIFTAGCNYRCYYCHNRQLLCDPPLISEAEVASFLEKRAGLIDGVVFTGGEPTMQKDIAWWLNRAKKLGYKVKLDTNGSKPDVLAGLLSAELIDYVAMDYKAPFDMYGKICQAGAAGVKTSLEQLMQSGIKYELRTTVVPQLGEKELMRMAREIGVTLPKWALQLYRPQQGDELFLEGREPYRPGELEAFASGLKQIQVNTEVRA